MIRAYSTALGAALLAFAVAAPHASAQDLSAEAAELDQVCRAAYDQATSNRSQDDHNRLCGCMAGEAQERLAPIETELFTAILGQDAERMNAIAVQMDESNQQSINAFVEALPQRCN